MDKRLENRIRLEIHEQLRLVTEGNSPYVFSMIQSESGYLFIEQEVIERMLATGLTPASVIPQIESDHEML